MTDEEEDFRKQQGMLKRRLKPNSNRYGVIQQFMDAMQQLIMLQYEKDLFLHPPDGDDFDYMSPQYNPEVVDKMMDILKELRGFDITEIGPLYLTSGGRIVLDHGYGEHFMDGDTLLYSRAELRQGMNPYDLIKKIQDELKKRGKETPLQVKNGIQ